MATKKETTEALTIYAALRNVQKNLKAPKGQMNKFGGYKYRSAEDILEAVKPHLNANGLSLTIADEVVMIGSRVYIKATATLSNDNGETVTTSAFAREEEVKKGMDASQVTGAASSYARKYAMNGLFAIDDTKDSDTLNVSAEYTQPAWKTELDKSSDITEVLNVWNKYTTLQKDPAFVAAFSAKKKQLK